MVGLMAALSGMASGGSLHCHPVRERLRFLYGAEAGERTAGELDRVLDRFRARLGPRPPRSSPDQRDAILITYADTLLAPGLAPLRALDRFSTRHLDGLVSAVHVLPFFPSSSDYGFSVVDYLRVDPRLGDWADLAALGERFRFMVDFVLNHVSAQSAWFRGFLRGEPPYDRFFIAVDPETDLSGVTRPRTSPLLTRVEAAGGPRWVWTTFSADQVDLDYRNPEVLLRMVEVMLTYVERGASLLRMDAVGYLWKQPGTSSIHLPQTHEVVRLFREVLDAVAPDVAIVTETNVPHADNVAYFGDGRNEAQMVYQFPLAPLVVDALAHGDATYLAGWAAELRTPSAETTFFNFLASHDGVGVVPARGILPAARVEDLVRRAQAHGGQVSYKADPDGARSVYELNSTFFDLLSDPRGGEPWPTRLDRFVCSQAVMLALAGVPGIYVHSLLGSHNDRAGYARSGWKRDLNHERLDLEALEGRLADPCSEAAQVLARYAELLRLRRAQPAFHPQAPQRVLPGPPAVFALRRGPREGQIVLALHNLGAAPQAVELPPEGGRWVELTGDRRLGGGERLGLRPYEVCWLRSG
jgi:glucosylglycerate phosphorylase